MLKCHIFVHFSTYLVSAGPTHLLMYLSWCILLLYLFYYFKIVIIWIINMGPVLLKYIEYMTYFSPNLMKYQIFLYIWTQNEYKNVRCHMVWMCEDLDTIFLQSIRLCGKMVEMFKNALTFWKIPKTLQYHIIFVSFKQIVTHFMFEGFMFKIA